MKVLAVDTSSNIAGVAISIDNNITSSQSINNKKTHSQTIMPMIDEALKNSNMQIEDVDLFVYTNGPGSFTGLRIGSSIVKAFAHALNKPVVQVSTLEALAYNIAFSDALIVPIMDARRNQVYTAGYKRINGKIELCIDEDAMDIKILLDIIDKKNETAVFLGDGVSVYQDYIKANYERHMFAPANLRMQNPASVLQCGLEKYYNSQAVTYKDVSLRYLRKPQAEREYDEREKIK